MKKFDSIDMIPFIDIILVLLAIILTTANFIDTGKISITLPTSEHTQEINIKTISILLSINKAGDIFYNETKVSLSELDNNLKKIDKNTNITLKIDPKSLFQQFISVSDILKQNQLTKITVLSLFSKAKSK